jgi:hypothetical protein
MIRIPNNAQEAWAEILKARDAVAVAKTENEKAYTQLNLARAELHYEMILTVAQLKLIENENLKGRPRRKHVKS